MHALRITRFGNPLEVLSLEERPDPEPGPGEVLVRVEAAPIHPSDLLTVQGLYGALPRLPATGGGEGVGLVQRAGPGVSLPEGARVLLPLGCGSWSTHVLVRAEAVVPVAGGAADQLSMACINPPTAALLLREFVALKPGEWVVQNAANSAVGLALATLARRAGLRTVNVVRREGLEPLLTLAGGDVVLVDGDDLTRRIRQATGGAAVRLSIDAVGGTATGRLLEATASGGTLVCYGIMSGKPGVLSAAPMVFRDVRVRGFWLVRSLQERTPQQRADLMQEMAALVADGTLRAPIDASYRLDQWREAVGRALQGGRDGKVLLVPAAS